MAVWDVFEWLLGLGAIPAEQLLGDKASLSKEWLCGEEELKMFFLLLFSFVASNSLAGLYSMSHSWLQ